MKNIYILIIVLAVGATSFFGGMKYQQSQRTNFQRFGPGANEMQFRGPSGQGVNRQEFQPLNGEIIKAEEKSLTVKLEDGSTKIVILGDSTKISKAEEIKTENVKEGDRVLVMGTANSDGSVTAQSVQLNPIEGIMFRRSN